MKSCIGVKMTGKTGTSDQMKTLRENRRLLAKMPKQSLEEDCHPVPAYGGKYGFVSPPPLTGGLTKSGTILIRLRLRRRQQEGR